MHSIVPLLVLILIAALIVSVIKRVHDKTTNDGQVTEVDADA